MKFKSKVLGLATVGLLVGSMAARADLIYVTFTITCDDKPAGTCEWIPGGLSRPYGLSDSPSLSGTMTVDNLDNDARISLVDFALTTGTKSWTEDDFAVNEASDVSHYFIFDGDGNVDRFGLQYFGDYLGSGGIMSLFSNNNFAVYNPTNLDAYSSLSCNGCVMFTQSREPNGGGGTENSVPEPGTLALLGLGLAGLGLSRKRKAH